MSREQTHVSRIGAPRRKFVDNASTPTLPWGSSQTDGPTGGSAQTWATLSSAAVIASLTHV